MSETDHRSEDTEENPSYLRIVKSERRSLQDVFRWVHRHHPKKLGAKATDFKATAYKNLVPFIEGAIRDNPDLALTDEQADVNLWPFPKESTFYRVFDAPYQSEHPRKRIQGLLFVARCLIERYKGQEGWEEQSSRLEGLIRSLGCNERAVPKEVIRPVVPEIGTGFVPLALIPDRDAGFRPGGTLRAAYDDLGEFLRDTPEHPVTVLLGDPGAGKSTLLRHLERRRLDDGAGVEPLLVPMGEYRPAVRGGTLPEPLPWLEALWARRRGKGTPRLEERLRRGKVLLLLDAVNETPFPDPVVAAFHALGEFLMRYVLPFSGNRAVVSCRPLEYVASLPLGGLHVPVVRVQPMDAARVALFVERSGHRLAPAIASELARDAHSFSLYRVPYFLRMLLETFEDDRSPSVGRARLFTRYVWRVLRRELERNPGQFGETLLTRHDRARVMNSPALPEGADLPNDGLLFPFLSDLAFRLQEAGDSGSSPTSWREAVRFASAGQPPHLPREAIESACALGLLDRNLASDSLRFYHQLLQEYFAARRMVHGFDPERWRVAWRIGEVEPFAPTSEGERLPPAKGTGWEETTVMAASLAPDPEAFVASVFERNVPLAGRCAESAKERIGATLAKRVREGLLGRMRDEEADLRSRIAAGLAIEDLAVLGYEVREEAGRRFLVPPTVAISGGEYPLGGEAPPSSDLRFHANALTLPEGERSVPDFQIGVYPVTNAEFACFIEDGGYEDEAWWTGKDAKAWRLGDGEAQGLRWQMRQNLQIDREWGAVYLQEQVGRRWSRQDAEDRIERLDWTPTKYEEWLERNFPSGRRLTLPGEWANGELNAASQPVVGVSWFEANAYCAWLSSVTGSRYRLLTEFEYEVAAAGRERRGFAYGMDFDSTNCNTYPSRVWRPTPVGLYANATPEGAYDLTGNVWTWTSSTDDAPGGVEPSVSRRVTRGGSHDTPAELATTLCRDSNHPGYRDRYDGFRLAKG